MILLLLFRGKSVLNYLVRFNLSCELSLSIFGGLQMDPQLLLLQGELSNRNMT